MSRRSRERLRSRSARGVRGALSAGLVRDDEKLLAKNERAKRAHHQIERDEPRCLRQGRASGVGQKAWLHLSELEAGDCKQLGKASLAQWHVVIEEVPVDPREQPYIRAEEDQRSCGAQYPQRLADDFGHIFFPRQ